MYGVTSLGQRQCVPHRLCLVWIGCDIVTIQFIQCGLHPHRHHGRNHASEEDEHTGAQARVQILTDGVEQGASVNLGTPFTLFNRCTPASLNRCVLGTIYPCFQTRVCFDAASGCELTDVLQAGRGRCRLRSNHESHIQRDHVSTRTTRRTASGLRKR